MLDPLLLIPGYAGDLAPDELAYIRVSLRADRDLAYVWGFQRRRRTFPAALVQRLALYGSPDTRGDNVAIVRAWQRHRHKAISAAP